MGVGAVSGGIEGNGRKDDGTKGRKPEGRMGDGAEGRNGEKLGFLARVAQSLGIDHKLIHARHT